MRRGLLFIVVLALAGCAPQPSGPVTAVVDFAGYDPDEPGQIMAQGTVSGIAEDGGRCSFTFWFETGQASRLTATGTAAGDHTQCGPVSEEAALLLPGTWEVELKYSSDSGESTSGRVPLVIR